MFKVIDKPDTGKTRRLLEECSKNNGIFVCKHPERVVEKCVAYGIDPNTITPKSYRNLLNHFIGIKSIKSDTNVYIDDLDLLMKALSAEFDIDIEGYGVTVED